MRFRGREMEHQNLGFDLFFIGGALRDMVGTAGGLESVAFSHIRSFTQTPRSR